MLVTGTYDPYLVGLSILVAIFASCTALELAGHMATAPDGLRRVWLTVAALSLGGGIWSMHFVGMLAYKLPGAMSYEIGLTVLSLVVAIVVTGAGFYVLGHRGIPRPLIFGGLIMGLGIAAMHYTGMASMRDHADVVYDPRFVVLSLVIAVGAATIALWLAFRTTNLAQKLVGAVVMGLAISGMHYSAMAGTSFSMHASHAQSGLFASFDQTHLALAVAGITFVILATALVAAQAERSRAEEALREAQSDLARANRLTTMGALTASLAHEVNQPIAAAITHANALQRWLAADPPNIERARASAAKCVESGTRAAEIVARLRLLFEKGTPRREAVDVNEIVRELMLLLRGEMARNAISARVDLAADLPAVVGDRLQLQQLVMNLVVNGIDAMKDVDGPRELTIKSQRIDDKMLLLRVTDSGIGLPPQQTDRIFAAFFTTKPHGIGMGLSICRSIVEAHSGRLWAADNLPSGACFHVLLPIDGAGDCARQ